MVLLGAMLGLHSFQDGGSICNLLFLFKVYDNYLAKVSSSCFGQILVPIVMLMTVWS